MISLILSKISLALSEIPLLLRIPMLLGALWAGVVWWYNNFAFGKYHGCQMAIARFLDRMRLALWAFFFFHDAHAILFKKLERKQHYRNQYAT